MGKKAAAAAAAPLQDGPPSKKKKRRKLLREAAVEVSQADKPAGVAAAKRKASADAENAPVVPKKKRKERGGAAGEGLQTALPEGRAKQATPAAQENVDAQRNRKSKRKSLERKAAQAAAEPQEKRDAKPAFYESALRVFISGIPKDVAEATLRKDFEECGEVVNVKLLTNRDTGESRGLAFITYKDEAGFKAALEYDGQEYGGGTVRVKKAEAKGESKDGAAGAAEALDLGPKPEGCNSVVVKRLHPEVTSADLHRLFGKCGDGPTHVGLLVDKVTGKSRRTARIDFADTEAVDEAVKVAAGAKLRGAPFTIGYCKPRAWAWDGS